jgi:hypothetical protein
MSAKGCGQTGGMKDCAGAWTAERGRCHRFVYGYDDGHPNHCPEPPDPPNAA